VRFEGSPHFDRFIVSPKRQGKDFARFRMTLESFNRNETINFGEYGPQSGRDIQIFIRVTVLWPHFEDNGDHLPPP
jgi:hypothetical protein